MTILVTGATGFLGNVVVEQCLAAGAAPIRCLARPGSARSSLEAIRARFGRDSIEIVEGNLTRQRDVERTVADVECVVHLAAAMRGAAADMFLNTVIGTQRLLDAMVAARVGRLVLVSSLGVYGLADVAPDSVVQETTPLDPHPERRDVYTHTKILQEQLVMAATSRASLDAIVLRPGPLYGRGRNPLPSRLGLQVGSLLLRLGRDASLPLSFVDNCAHAVRLAALDPHFAAGAYNVVDDDPPRASSYVRRYRREVDAVRTIRIAYPATLVLAGWAERYHRYSRGQIPKALTPYRVRNVWRGHTYDTTRLKEAGWQQPVPTCEALDAAFHALRSEKRRAPTHR